MDTEFQKLKQELRKLYPATYDTENYDILDIEQVKKLIRQKEGERIITRLKKCKPGMNGWKEFQDICLDLVKLTLENEEFYNANALPEVRSEYVPFGEKGIRKDIVIPLNPKPDPNGTNIWDTFKNEPWSCKYLVFDAKNYNNKIKDRQIYQMFHYLSRDKGRIGIIFSRKHKLDESGKFALDRLRDESYMIFIFNDDDFEQWVESFIKGTIKDFFRDKFTKYEHSFKRSVLIEI